MLKEWQYVFNYFQNVMKRILNSFNFVSQTLQNTSRYIAFKKTFLPPRERTHTHTHTYFRVHSLKKGVSENEAPGPVGAYTTTHNNTPTPMPDRFSKLRTTTFDQGCSFCREESGS